MKTLGPFLSFYQRSFIIREMLIIFLMLSHLVLKDTGR